uniref:Uncharacterized protein n=1 Tax=Glossina morsitans morsitans TaxID=37546 RepID=A0A1B0G0L9_GLOMM
MEQHGLINLNDWVHPYNPAFIQLNTLELPNGDINVSAFNRMAAIVGAFTKHMHAVKTTEAPTNRNPNCLEKDNVKIILFEYVTEAFVKQTIAV